MTAARVRAVLRAWWPFLVPVAAAALAFATQMPDHLGAGPEPYDPRFFYDDADSAAYTLRGVNANLGRTPGPGVFWPYGAEVYPKKLAAPAPPLRDRYFLEYPHAALFVFRAASAAFPPTAPWPSTVLDAHYVDIYLHRPSTDAERAIWRTFRETSRVYVVLNVLALLAMMAVLRRGLGPGGAWAGPVWLLVLPGTLYFVLGRFDAIPSLFVVLGFAAAGRRRVALSGALFGVATALKLYPLLIAPLVWRYMTTDAKAGVRWAVAYLLPVAAFLGVAVALDGVDGMLAPYRYQLTRPLEPLWTFHEYLLPDFLALSSAWRLGVVAGVAAVLFALPRRGLGAALRRSAVVLIVFANIQVFFSPQWVLWFVPLLVPAARRSRTLLTLLVVNDVVTYVSFPLVTDLIPWWRDFERQVMIAWRAATLAAILGYLGWAEVRALRRGEPA